MIEKLYGRKPSKGEGMALVYLSGDGGYAWVQYDYAEGAGSREFYGSTAEREADSFLVSRGFAL